MTTIRVYGLTDGYGSYAQVLRGFELAFQAYGYGPDRLATVSLEARSEDAPPGLPEADAAIFLGPHGLASAIEQHARHRVKCVLVMPNSDRLPEPSMQTVNRYATHVLCPSEWAAAIVSRYTDKPILVTPLGVLPGFGSVGGGEERVEQYARGEFRVLHLSSSTRQRKGTAELVLAWEQLRKSGAFSPEARLTLVLVPEMRMAVIEWLSDRGVTGVMAAELGIELANRLHGKGAPPDQMAHVYGAHHVVCQPSRGESFGLCSLEALACGTPIVATQATGHSQWFASGLPGAVPIPVGPYAEIDDLAGARAPAVRPSDIADALEFARAQWLTLRAAALENAARTREVWSYAESLRPLQTLIEAHS